MKSLYGSLLILFLTISASAFYNNNVSTLYQNPTVTSAPITPYDSTWALKTKCNHSYYGVSYWGVTNTLLDLRDPRGYKLNYNAVSVVKSNGTSKTWVLDTSIAPAFPNDTINDFTSDIFYDEINTGNYMYLVYNDSINSKTYIDYMNITTDSMWTQKWVVPWTFKISKQSIIAHKNNLYLIHGDSLYMANNSIFTSVINNSCSKVAFNSNYIYSIYNQSLYRFNEDGSNKITLKTSRPYFDSVYSFAINPIDTTTFFSINKKDAGIYYDKNGNKEVIASCTYATYDTLRGLFIDTTGDIWFHHYGVLDTVNIYKIDNVNHTLTGWRYLDGNYPYPPSNDYHRNMFGHYQTGNMTFYTGNKFIIKSYTINHKPKISRIAVNDTINYIDATSKQITYNCTLKVTDDNPSDMHVFYKMTGPSWFTIDTSTVANHKCIININTTNVDTGTYNIQARVRDTFYNISNPLFSYDTISWTIKVKHTYSDLISILSTKDTGWVENTTYSCTLAVGNNLTYSSTLPSMMAIDSLTLKAQNKTIVKSRTLVLSDTNTYSLRVIVTNNYNEKDTINWSYTIASGKITIKNKSTIEHKGTLSLSNRGTTYDTYIALTDKNNSIAYIHSMNIPSWITVSRVYNQSKTFRFIANSNSNVPSSGSYPFNVIFTDSSTTSTPTYDTINYTITLSPPISITKPDTAFVGNLYTIITSYSTSYNDSIDAWYRIINRPSQGVKLDSTYILNRKALTTETSNFIMSPSTVPNDTNLWVRGYSNIGYKINWTPTINDTGTKKIIIMSYLNYTTSFPETTSTTGTSRRDTINVFVKYVPILPVNNPVVVTNNDTTITLTLGDSTNFSLNATDADADPIAYSSTQSFITNINNVYKIKPIATGTYTAHLIATDTKSYDSCKIIIVVNPKPNSPVIITKNDTTITLIVNDSVSVTVSATDADNDPITYSTLKSYASNVGNIFKIKPTTTGHDTLYIIASDGQSFDTCRIILTVNNIPPAIKKIEIPVENAVNQNYPNPFNPVTTISYAVKEPTKVSIEIYNLKGQKVITLINKTVEPGYHSVVWNATNHTNNPITTGTYIYKTTIGDYQKIQKMQLMK